MRKSSLAMTDSNNNVLPKISVHELWSQVKQPQSAATTVDFQSALYKATITHSQSHTYMTRAQT